MTTNASSRESVSKTRSRGALVRFSTAHAVASTVARMGMLASIRASMDALMDAATSEPRKG